MKFVRFSISLIVVPNKSNSSYIVKFLATDLIPMAVCTAMYLYTGV